MTQHPIPYSPLPVPRISCAYLDEPSLLFCGNREHVSARTGITLFGPRSLDVPGRHPDTTRVGFIGSGASIESAYQWLSSCLPGVAGDSEHDAFPGYTEHQGFYASLAFSDRWNEQITQNDLRAVAQRRFARTVLPPHWSLSPTNCAVSLTRIRRLTISSWPFRMTCSCIAKPWIISRKSNRSIGIFVAR